MRAQSLGEHGRQNVGFFRVRQSGEDIRAVDVLLDQQLLVRGVAVQDDRVLEQLRYPPRAARIALDELHLVGFLERLGEPETDVAAARDDDPLDRVVLLAHLVHDAADVVAGREEKDLVAVLDDRIALGADAAALAIDRHDAGVELAQMLGQLAQTVADQVATFQRAYTDQAHFAVGEFEDLQRAGIADQALDILGDELLGADEDVHGQGFIAEKLRPARVFGRADACDFRRRAEQGEGHLARHHVDFVAVGERDDDIGLGRAGRLQHGRVGGVSRHRADIEPVLEIAQDLLIEVDDSDFVRFFAREVVGCGPADLAGPENDNFHLQRLEVRILHHQPLCALALEVDLDPRVRAVALDVENNTFTELPVANPCSRAGHRLQPALPAGNDRPRPGGSPGPGGGSPR